MLNSELKKDIIKLIIFTISLIFMFIYIKPLWLFIKSLITLIAPFIIGLVIAFVLNVLVNKIEYKLFNKCNIREKAKHNLSIIIALALVLSFLTFMIILIVPELKNTTTIFIDNIPKYQENVTELLDKVGIDEGVRESIIAKTKEFSDKATIYINTHSGKLIENVLGLATSVVMSVVNLVIAIIFALYLLVEKNNLLRQTNKVLNAYLPEKKVLEIKKVALLSNHTFANFISGQVLEATIFGIMCLIGMLLLRLPYAGTISILIGFTALIPIFGAFIGTAVGAFLIFMISPLKSLIFIIYILILQQIEGNIIYPKVMGKSVNLPAIWVLVAVTIGASISGIVGMLVAVPVSSVLYSILATNVNSRLEQKKKPHIKSKQT